MTCYDCGAANPPQTLQCESCGGFSLNTAGECRPRTLIPSVPDALPDPWDLLVRWPSGGAVSISGGPGSGKSSLGARLRARFDPMTWATAEQSGAQAAEALARIVGADRMPPIVVFRGPARLRDLFRGGAGRGLLVVDSLTQAGGWEEQAELAALGVEWVRAEPDRRLLFILQVNQRGDAAGRVQVPHLVDACLDIAGRDGLSTVSAWKNRFGPIGSRYFRLGAHGPERVAFPYAYSVEGERGSWRLHPYPLPGADWAGALKAAGSKGCVPCGVASAAIPVPGYPGGYLRPADEAERRDFAKAHGLSWYPEEEPDE